MRALLDDIVTGTAYALAFVLSIFLMPFLLIAEAFMRDDDEEG